MNSSNITSCPVSDNQSLNSNVSITKSEVYFSDQMSMNYVLNFDDNTNYNNTNNNQDIVKKNN
jgi:hypothetical protein